MSSADHKERLAAAKARRDAAAAQLEAAEAERREREQLEDVEREAALSEALLEARAKHGELGRELAIVHARYAGGHIMGSAIVKVATAGEWSRYRAKIEKAKGVEIDHATEALWRPNVVYPALAEVDRMIAALPFFSTALGDAVGRLCGVRVEELAGK